METDPAVRRLVLFMFQSKPWLYSLRDLKANRILRKHDYAGLLDLMEKEFVSYSPIAKGYGLNKAGQLYAEKLLLEEPKNQ
jgi:hypothetical protein